MVYFGNLVRRFAFGFAIFTSAFLLFQVQLLLSKFLLPWFGGDLRDLGDLFALFPGIAAGWILLRTSDLIYLSPSRSGTARHQWPC